MRWYWGFGSLPLCGAILGLRMVAAPTSEPLYAGKPVSEWLEGGYEQASLALQEIGSSAAPYVLAKLSREDPHNGSLWKYQALWRKAPPPLKSILPKPRTGNFDELRACSALLELGP